MGSAIYLFGIVLCFVIGCIWEYIDAKNPSVVRDNSIGDNLAIWFIVGVCWPLIAVFALLGGACFLIFGGPGLLIQKLAERNK